MMFKWNKFLILFLIILAAGTFLRLYDLNWGSYGYGEVEVYQSVQEFLRGNFTNNFYIYAETPLLKYIFTLFAFLGGLNEVSLRLVSAIFGIGSIAMIYLIVSNFYKDKWLALFAAMFTSFSLIHIQFSRYVQFEAALSFFFLLTFYFFLKFVENKTNKNAALLGISIGVGVLSKTAFLTAVIVIIVFSFLYKLIKVGIKPNFSLSVDNKLLKAFAISVITFFVLWPLAFFTLPVNITVDVGGHVNEVHANIPNLLLVFGYRFTEAGKAMTQNIFLNIPLAGQFIFFVVKENLIFVVAFFAGLVAVKKRFMKQDREILLFLLIFFALLSVQNFRYTYRYITIVIPLLAVVAARSISLIADYRKIVFAALFIALAVYALFVSPNYAIYYNPLNHAFSIPESEGRFNEGMREVINSISDCKEVQADNFFVFMIEPYLPGVASANWTDADCAVKGIGNNIDQAKTEKFLSDHTCSVKEEVVLKGQKLFEIYRC